MTSRDLSIDYKCALARKVSANPEAFRFKVGAVGSPAPGLQYVQGVGSALVPGNITRYTNPLRSGTWSALTPGGSNRTGGILGRLGASRTEVSHGHASNAFSGPYGIVQLLSQAAVLIFSILLHVYFSIFVR